MKPRWKIASLIGLTCLLLMKQGYAGGCDGDNLAIPDTAAFASIQKLAESGDAMAQARIGNAYLARSNDRSDYINKAIYWLNKSANGGNIDGQYILGKYYVLNGKEEKDYQKAAGWLKKSADKGCTQSLAYLGVLSLSGKGVKKNPTKGFGMILKAAEEGYPPAQFMAGTLLITGEGGKRDAKEGYIWVKKAADTGDSASAIMLATLYLDGTGTAQDPEKARIILQSVLKKGDEKSPTAAYYLGWIYMEGKGVKADKIRALELMIIAANAHISDSEARVRALTDDLPKQKLAHSCSVYMNPNVTKDSTKEYLRANVGEIVLVMRQFKRSLEVYFPNRPLVGFIPSDCIN